MTCAPAYSGSDGVGVSVDGCFGLQGAANCELFESWG